MDHRKPTNTFPGATWERTDPVTAGFDPAKLDEIAKRAETAGSTCLAVFRDGKLVRDWYWNGGSAEQSENTWSVTKSVTSTLVGIAQDEGELDINEPASKYIAEWAGTPSEMVTPRHILSGTSGRHFDLVWNAGPFLVADDQTALAIGLEQDAAPDTVWTYNDPAIQTLSRVLKTSTGTEAAEYAKRHLFEPIGMTHSEMAKDGAGSTLMYGFLRSTCLDLGRFGHLFLNQGNWGGRQIVSDGFVAEATGQSSQDLNGAYGYLWWLNRKGKIASARDPATRGTDDNRPVAQVAEWAPETMFWAAGFGEQTVQVDPGSNTVVVRLAPPFPPEGTKSFGRGESAKVVSDALVRK